MTHARSSKCDGYQAAIDMTPAICSLTRASCAVKGAADVPMVVVFGRPGSGKSTVAEKVPRILEEGPNPMAGSGDVIGLDLDVCIPQWMRDNFANVIYPTLHQRLAFGQSVCDYVDVNAPSEKAAVISFSFVNEDLRDIFRNRFPRAVWALVDVSDDVAKERIRTRKGHFYKGKLDSSSEVRGSEDKLSKECFQEKEVKDGIGDSDNSDWDFAPVEYPHLLLDGLDNAETNAQKVADALVSLMANKRI